MKIQKIITWAAAIAAVCLVAHTAKSQNMVGVNFVVNQTTAEYNLPGGVQNGYVDSLAPNEIAGVFPQGNWNNLGSYGDSIPLNGSNGAPSGLTIAWFSPGMWYEVWFNNGFPWPYVNPDCKLMDGDLESTWYGDTKNTTIPPGTAITNVAWNDTPIILVSNLNSFLLAQGGGTYSVVLYVEATGSHSQWWIQTASGPSSAIVTGVTNTLQLNVDNSVQFNGSNYVQVIPSATNYAAAYAGNYIVFGGLTNDEILIRCQNLDTSPCSALAGFQIVALGMSVPPQLSAPSYSPTNVVYAGSPVTISSGVIVGTPPIYFQWETDGGTGGDMSEILDATNLTLSVIASSTGTYKYCCVGSNSFGLGISQTNTLTVLPASAPLLTTDIATNTSNVYGFVGGSVSFYANFGLGTMPITNQWLFSSTGTGYAPVAGIGNNPWTLTNILSLSTGYYLLSATNAIGSSNSSPAYLTALADPAAPSSNGTTNMYAYCVYTNHPWAYWRFEETTNTLTNSMQAYDYSGHNFDATYGNSDGTSGAGCKDGGLSLAAGIYGPGHNDNLSGFPTRNGCATLANGKNNGYLTTPPLNLNTNTVTFTLWIYINPNDNLITPYTGLLMNRNGYDAAGICFGGNVTTNDYGVTSVSIAELGYNWNNNSASAYNWHSGLYPAVSTWNFVACTITPSNTTMYLYFVGQDAQLNTVTNLFKAVHGNVTNNPEAFSGGTTWIGSDNWNNGNTFDGYIDEVAVFTNAMTEAQLQDLFLRGLGMTTGIAPVFSIQPTNETVFQNQTITLSASATAIPAPWYQWQYESGTTWSSLGTAVGRTPNDSTLIYSNWTVTSVTNFRCTATNFYGAATSSVAVVTTIPIANYNKGLWTVNFSVATTVTGGPGTPYVGPGLLGTNTYWNALGGNPFENATSLRDDGSTYSGVMLGVTNSYIGTYSSGQYYSISNALLDQYAQVLDTNNGGNFFLTQVPNGRYNLALYGCTAAYADRGAGFTVYTNGVSAGTQWITNKQDTYFRPYDNAVVYTNLVVTNGMLQVNESIARVTPSHTNSTEADFNGAQLELITYGPNVLSLTNSGTNLVLTYAGGFVLQSTNVTGPWTTNTTVGAGAITINPTGQLKFYRVWTNKAF